MADTYYGIELLRRDLHPTTGQNVSGCRRRMTTIVCWCRRSTSLAPSNDDCRSVEEAPEADHEEEEAVSTERNKWSL